MLGALWTRILVVFAGFRSLENPSLLPETSHNFVIAVTLEKQYLDTTKVRLATLIEPPSSCRRRPSVRVMLWHIWEIFNCTGTDLLGVRSST